MKAILHEERDAELRRAIGQRRLTLDDALDTLARVGTEQLTVSGRIGADPWAWMLGACAVGVFCGLWSRRR